MHAFFKRVLLFVLRHATSAIYCCFSSLPYFHFIRRTRQDQCRITFKIWFIQKVLGINRDVYWPVHYTSKINQYKNIQIGIDTSPGYEPGCYIQGIGKVYIGNYTQIAANVGIISANHDVYDSRKHLPSTVRIGSYCWLGMGTIVLPGVQLGDFTIVAAGSIVTKSFVDGHCVIAGNPAREVKKLIVEKCIRYKNKNEYIGYYAKEEFSKYKDNNLWIKD